MLFLFIPLCLSANQGMNTKIYFRYANSSIENGFKQNAESLHFIDSVFKSVDVTNVVKVKIEGSASHEGSDSFNIQLSNARALALRNYIISKYRIPESLFLLSFKYDNGGTNPNAENLRYAYLVLENKTLAKKSNQVKIDNNLNKNFMENFMLGYVHFFNANWIYLAILSVLVIILARTKMEMAWLDIIIPSVAFSLWGIFALILFVF